ncbi:MAG: hypothetical protein IJJ64_10585 [Butyrivibrio sp.]|nr:hypothetical protein [Butyrivibrio sp.]
MTEMLNALDAKLFIAKTRAQEFFKDLKDGEYGVSAVIATVILVAIALVLAIAFWEKIAEVYKKITGQIDQNTEIKKDLVK